MIDDKLELNILNKLNLCYKIVDNNSPNFIYYIYDESYIRKKKLCKINNNYISPPNKVNDVCLFGQNIQTKVFYCDVKMWWKIQQENNYTYDETKNYIEHILKKKQRTTFIHNFNLSIWS